MTARGGRATLAIVRWQARCELGPWIQCLAGVLFGVSVLPEYAADAGTVRYAVALAVVIVAGVGGWMALAFRPAQVAELTCLRYLAAPLYGRELARAHAIVPCAKALLFPAGIAAGMVVASLLLHRPLPAASGTVLAALALGQPVVALVALCGCLRRGRGRMLYAALAALAGATIESVGIFGGPIALAGAALAACVIGFAALRALGETLARYDPVWT